MPRRRGQAATRRAALRERQRTHSPAPVRRRGAARRGAGGRARAGSGAARARDGGRCGPCGRASWPSARGGAGARRARARGRPSGGGPARRAKRWSAGRPSAGRSGPRTRPAPAGAKLPVPAERRPGRASGPAPRPRPTRRPRRSAAPRLAARVRGSGRARAGISKTRPRRGRVGSDHDARVRPQSASSDSLRGSSRRQRRPDSREPGKIGAKRRVDGAEHDVRGRRAPARSRRSRSAEWGLPALPPSRCGIVTFASLMEPTPTATRDRAPSGRRCPARPLPLTVGFAGEAIAGGLASAVARRRARPIPRRRRVGQGARRRGARRPRRRSPRAGAGRRAACAALCESAPLARRAGHRPSPRRRGARVGRARRRRDRAARLDRRAHRRAGGGHLHVQPGSVRGRRRRRLHGRDRRRRRRPPGSTARLRDAPRRRPLRPGLAAHAGRAARPQRSRRRRRRAATLESAEDELLEVLHRRLGVLDHPSFHASEFERAGWIAKLCAAGVPVCAEEISDSLAGLLGTELAALLDAAAGPRPRRPRSARADLGRASAGGASRALGGRPLAPDRRRGRDRRPGPADGLGDPLDPPRELARARDRPGRPPERTSRASSSSASTATSSRPGPRSGCARSIPASAR